ncbi:MAG: putative ABC transport system ATP-binding protein [Desulfobacteraceae bacterium Eth-SRB2]|nr:MAG: putative ABC transport system ATP-binding protein [Desulfobacteraceae bacterium Eth-SRB2]
MADLIETRNLVKVYNSGDVKVVALDEISLTIDAGGLVAVMGPSGSGKSTFMNILGCLDKPTTGKYFLEGIDMGNLDRDQLAHIRNRKIGFVFQTFNLLARTSALENVELPLIYSGVPAGKRREMAMDALHSVGLSGREDHYPNQLSGGEQQRVAIARALVNSSAIILADEPTGNLDSKSSHEIISIFQRLNIEKGITVIIVTHEPDVAAFTRRNIIFRDGKVAEDKIAQKNTSA